MNSQEEVAAEVKKEEVEQEIKKEVAEEVKAEEIKQEVKQEVAKTLEGKGAEEAAEGATLYIYMHCTYMRA